MTVMKSDNPGKCPICLAPGKMCGTSPPRMALCSASDTFCTMSDGDSAVLLDAWEDLSYLRQERDLLLNLYMTLPKGAHCDCGECSHCKNVEAYEKWKNE